MYRPIELSVKPIDKSVALLESFNIKDNFLESVEEPEFMLEDDSIYTEAVFSADAKKKLDPIVESLGRVKDILDEEINKQETSDSSKTSPSHKFDPKAYWRNSAFKELENKIQQVFGFRSVQIQPYIEKYNSADKTFESKEINCIIFNANRYPIDGLVTDKGFYDNTHSLNLDIYVTLGLMRILTKEELMATILHEFGHAIDPALVDIKYMEVNILSKYLTDRVSEVNNKEKKFMNDKKQKRGLLKMFTHAATSVGFSIKNVARLFGWVVFGKDKKEEKRLSKIRELLAKEKDEFNRQNYSEAFADNFARMYGYGPQLASAFKKFAADINNTVKSRFKKEQVRQEVILNLIMKSLDDVHKTDMHRVHALVKEYKNDINDPNTPPEVKKQLEEDLRQLEAVVRAFTNDFDDFQNKVNKVIYDELSKNDPELVRKDPNENKEDVIKEGYDFFDEASHGKLKYDFRIGIDVNSGHLIKIVYSLDNISVDDIGYHSNEYFRVGRNKEMKQNLTDKGREHIDTLKKADLEKSQKEIRKTGNTDHRSSGQMVLAIEDMVNKKRLQEVTIIGPFVPHHLKPDDVNRIGKDKLIAAIDMLHKENRIPADIAKQIAKSPNERIFHNKVGTIDTDSTYKSTYLAKNLAEITRNEDFTFGRGVQARKQAQTDYSIDPKTGKHIIPKGDTPFKVAHHDFVKGMIDRGDYKREYEDDDYYGDPLTESRKAYEELKKRSETVTSAERAKFYKIFGYSKACSLAKDKDGYYVYTHRCRSKSYPSIEDIPKEKVEFIRRTA